MSPILRFGLLLLALLLATPIPAQAAPEDEPSIEQEVLRQMEAILRLMRENEDALLGLSTGEGGRAEGVEVEPPPAEGVDGAPTAAEILRKIAELLEDQRSTSARIPDAIQELLKMIPQTSGQGGSAEPQDGSSETPRPEPREGTRPEDQTGDPEAADGDSPRDPRRPEDRPGETRPDTPPSSEEVQRLEAQGWFARLPPTLRDAFVRGDFERIPAEYRGVLERVRRWLLRYGD